MPSRIVSGTHPNYPKCEFKKEVSTSSESENAIENIRNHVVSFVSDLR